MATKGQNYAVGIGTGAAGGAAAGTAILPGWGTAIGAGVGAIGGAISAGLANKKEADEKRHLEQAQERSRQSILYNLYRQMAQSGGLDTTYPDTLMQLKGEQLAEQSQNANFAAAHRIDPNSFVPMAQYGAQAAGGLYKAFSGPGGGSPDFKLPSGGGDFAGGDFAGGGVGGDIAGQGPLPSIANPDERQDWLRSLA